MAKSVIFNVWNGLIHGLFIGMIFGLGVYLLALVVQGLGFLNTQPSLLGGVVFAAGTLGGIAKEYNDWLARKQ